MYKSIRRGLAAKRLLDEKLYEYVALEVQNKIVREGLWAQALVLCKGSERQAKAKYIELRVQSLKDEASIVEYIDQMISDMGGHNNLPKTEDMEEPKKIDEDSKNQADSPKQFPSDYIDKINWLKDRVDSWPSANARLEIEESKVILQIRNLQYEANDMEELELLLHNYGFYVNEKYFTL